LNQVAIAQGEQVISFFSVEYKLYI